MTAELLTTDELSARIKYDVRTIRERLKEDEVRQRIAELVGKARTDMQIAVLTKRLPFKYTGTLPKSENE